MAKKKEREYFIILMAINMKESGKMIQKKEKGFITGRVEIDMKEIIKMAISVEAE